MIINIYKRYFYIRAPILINMKKLFCSFFVLLFCVQVSKAQTPAPVATPSKLVNLSKINQRALVRDSTGKRYDYTAWSSMAASGHYGIKVATLPNEKPSLIIGRLTRAERDEVMAQMPKPEPSTYFKTGDPIRPFKETSIDGADYDTKKLTGKIIVLSFCDLKNSSSLRAIPDINELAQMYQYNTDVVFLSAMTDNKEQVQQFLASTPVKGHVLDRGKSLSSRLSVVNYPTFLVVDQAGKVQYHSTGYTPSTAYWMGKSIEELIAKK